MDETFGNRWIGRGGPITLPPRFPKLTPLHFFLWGLRGKPGIPYSSGDTT
jgi:hypothetical protein